MSEKIERIIETIDNCLDGLEVDTSPDLIAEQAWNNLQQSVEMGWVSEQQAEQMFYEWFIGKGQGGNM